MTVEIYKSHLPVDEGLLVAAGREWKRFPKLLSKDTPKGVKKFLGRRPGVALGENEFSDAHFQFALLLALAGEREALVPLFRGDLLMEEAVKPARSTKMESRRVVNRWCAQRVGLSGWAEVFDAPPNSEPGPEAHIPRVSFNFGSDKEYAGIAFDEKGDLEGAMKVTPSNYVVAVRMILDGLTWLLVARDVPWMNDYGWERERIEREVAWHVGVVRARLGLPLEQAPLTEDPRVDLPVEFTGFVSA